MALFDGEQYLAHAVLPVVCHAVIAVLRVHIVCHRQDGDGVRQCNSRSQQEHGRRNNSA
jgi:hypothetical protein